MGEVVALRSRHDALAWGDAWQRQAERLEMLLLCAEASKLATEALLRIAEDEIARIRGV